MGGVTNRLPTVSGDVLILVSRETSAMFTVGSVSRMGQFEFGHSDDVAQLTTIVLAAAAAKALVRPQGRIYLVDIDAEAWSELPS
jgi:hypothetical protein